MTSYSRAPMKPLYYTSTGIKVFIIYALFAESSIDIFKGMFFVHNISIEIAFACLL